MALRLAVEKRTDGMFPFRKQQKMKVITHSPPFSLSSKLIKVSKHFLCMYRVTYIRIFGKQSRLIILNETKGKFLLESRWSRISPDQIYRIVSLIIRMPIALSEYDGSERYIGMFA